MGETLTFVFGTCASSISVHRQTMCRRVEFCWSVGQWRAFLRGQSLLFSRESSGPRAALATRGAVFYFRFRSIAHTIFLFHCLDRGFTLTGLAPMRSKRSGDLERRRIRVAVGKEHFPSVKSFSKFPMVGLVPNRDACERRFTPALHRLVRQLRSSSIDPTNVSWSKSSEEGSERFFFFGRWGLRHVCL